MNCSVNEYFSTWVCKIDSFLLSSASSLSFSDMTFESSIEMVDNGKDAY